MSNRAWVTLATNDSYGLGALVLAHSLRRAGSAYPAVVLITPTVTEAMRDRLRAVFADVVIVDVLDSKDAAHLALLQRPELGITFTKIHCWNLTQYEKCVFLDADTLIIQNCDELFEREELSAAPDVGWPDCFNSGVFVFKPSTETFDSLIKFAQERGSFDGGDQGLLNSYFSDWAHGDINKHLPFLYNVTSAAFYSYLPALKHYGQNLKIIHFIGAAKPWLQHFNWETRTAEAPQHLREFLQLWWDIFVGHVHSVLDISMVEVEEALPAVAPQETFFHTEPRLDYHHYEPILDPESEFPWHHPDAQINDVEPNVPEIDMTQFHDPWDIYRGNIPPNSEDTSTYQPNYIESQKAENHEEIRKYAWDYMSPQHHQPAVSQSSEQNFWQYEHSHQSQYENIEQSYQDYTENVWDINSQCNYTQDRPQSPQNFYEQENTDKNMNENCNKFDYNQENMNYHHPSHAEHFQRDTQINVNEISNIQKKSFKHEADDRINDVRFQKYEPAVQYASHTHNRVEHVYCLHLDHEKIHKKTDINETEVESKINGHGEADWEIFENLRPRHPYDGFYLRHQMTIDSRGRKICTHEVPPTPTPSPPESPIPTENWVLLPPDQEEKLPNHIEDQTGVAGNLARVVLGASAQQEALDDLTRRQGWEAGNIDYMGADAFDNIWAKISQTLSQPRSSPPKQSTPPPAPVDIPPPAAPVEAAQPVLETPVAQAPSETSAPVMEPAPVETAPLAETPKPADDSVQVAAPVQESTAIQQSPAEASVEATKPLESSAPAESITEVPESDKVSESDEAGTVPISAAVSAAVSETTEVVTPVVPVEEPKIAASAAAPVASATKEPEVPVDSPAAIPPEAAKTETDAAPVPSKVEAAPAVAPTIKPASPTEIKGEVTPEKGASPTDSPPLANTPSKEDVPIVPAAKSEERRKPAGELRLLPPAPISDTLPTPDSEQEDAAALAHAIIASELRTPLAASPTPPTPDTPLSPATDPTSPPVASTLPADTVAPASPQVVSESPTSTPVSPQVDAALPQAAPESPPATPGSPQVAPESPSAIPRSPQVAPESPAATPESPPVPPVSSQVTRASPQITSALPQEAPASPPAAPASPPVASALPSAAPASPPTAPASPPAAPASPPVVPVSPPAAPASPPAAPATPTVVPATPPAVPASPPVAPASLPAASASPPAAPASPSAAPASPPAAPASPPAAPASPPVAPATPPAGAVPLSQPKSKATTAAQIESSVAAAESADAPKKRVVKKVLKKEGASGEAPVPPPRKKEKKPKDK